MLKQYHTYRIAFSGKPARAAGGLMGLYLFFAVLYHFFLSEASRYSAIGWIIDILLPICLSVGMILLLCVIRLNAPGVYGIIGAILCLVLAVSTFSDGSALRIILALVWYLICAAVLLLTSGGFLPQIPLASCLLFIAAFVRFLFFDLGALSSPQWVLELGQLSGIVSLAILPQAFQPVKRK